MSNNLLDYEDFKGRILAEATRFYGDSANVQIRSVVKNNGVKLDGLTITECGSNISPAIYLNGFYSEYVGGRSLQEVVRKIVEVYERNRAEKCFDLSCLGSFESIRDRLGIRLVNYERNRDELRGMPHKRFADLAIVYMLVFNHTNFGNASMLIKNEQKSLWGVGDDELHAAALAGALLIQRPVVRKLTDYIREFMDEEEPADDMTVLTNENGLYGASVMVYKGLLESMSKSRGGDLYIIPSSVHEVIILPVSDRYDPACLRDMVKSVNETVVEPSEILSDNLYVYHCENDRISRS
jgi:hypothetical protein